MQGVSKSRVRLGVGVLALAVATLAAFALAGAAPPAGAPAELKVGFVDFLSGPAVLFGASGKNTAEWLVDKWNKEGGAGDRADQRAHAAGDVQDDDLAGDQEDMPSPKKAEWPNETMPV